MSHHHFVQKERTFHVNKKEYSIKKNVNPGQLKRLDCIIDKTHYIYFEGTYIAKIINDIFHGELKKYKFASYDINLPSFIYCQIPGLVVKTKILYDPKFDEKKIKNLKTYLSKNKETTKRDLKNVNNIEESLKLLNMSDLFDTEVHIKRNGATCPKKSTFFPIIRQMDNGDFSFIDCLKMYDVNNKKNLYYYLPIQGPIDKGGSSYPNIIDGTVPFYVILNKNEFANLNASLNKKIKKYSDIENLQAATKYLKEMRWSLSYRVRDGLNFALIYDGKTIFGYQNNKPYRHHPPSY